MWKYKNHSCGFDDVSEKVLNEDISNNVMQLKTYSYLSTTG
jgi:hypothetical protein